MASKKGCFPEVIFIAPIGNSKKKVQYRFAVFEVHETSEAGSPSMLRLVEDIETIDLSAENAQRKFITAYIPKNILQSVVCVDGGSAS